jgi:hypothetical protein
MPGHDGRIDRRYLLIFVDLTTYRMTWGARLATDPVEVGKLGEPIDLPT